MKNPFQGVRRDWGKLLETSGALLKPKRKESTAPQCPAPSPSLRMVSPWLWEVGTNLPFTYSSFPSYQGG